MISMAMRPRAEKVLPFLVEFTTFLHRQEESVCKEEKLFGIRNSRLPFFLTALHTAFPFSTHVHRPRDWHHGL